MIKIKTLDLVGKTFEELTVLERDLSINKKGTYWKCLCSCGNVKTIRGTSLTSGNTKSCGHLQKERLTEIHNKNIKDITG